MIPRVLLVVWIGLASLLVTACAGSSSLAAVPGSAAPRPIAQASPAITRTPSGIFISTSEHPTIIPAVTVATSEVNSTGMIVLGRVYDAVRGQRLNNATIQWQFLSPDQQPYDGQLQVPDDGFYRLLLPIHAEDEIIITARAPGYLPSMARLQGKQLNPYGSRLDFGLVKPDGPLPTLPGALGIIQLTGIVYNSAHGLNDPIANAQVTIVDQSLVEPETQILATTGTTGTFAIPVALHATDQLAVTIAASGYETVTLAKSASDLARKPQLLIGMMPAPKQ